MLMVTALISELSFIHWPKYTRGILCLSPEGQGGPSQTQLNLTSMPSSQLPLSGFVILRAALFTAVCVEVLS